MRNRQFFLDELANTPTTHNILLESILPILRFFEERDLVVIRRRFGLLNGKIQSTDSIATELDRSVGTVEWLESEVLLASQKVSEPFKFDGKLEFLHISILDVLKKIAPLNHIDGEILRRKLGLHDGKFWNAETISLELHIEEKQVLEVETDFLNLLVN